jgi:hypothetical protein
MSAPASVLRLGSSPQALRTPTLNEAAAFLHMHPEEVRIRAKRGLIPGAKAGRRWIDFVAPNGERIRRSTETADRKEAAELHDKLKSEVWRVQRLGDRPKRIWQDAVVRWLRQQAHKASLRDDKRMLRWLHRFLADRQ